MWLGIGSAIKHWGKYLPDKTAILLGSKEFTYKELYYRSISISNYICQTDLDCRIAVVVKDKFEYLSCIVGLNIINIPIIILNPYISIEALEVNLNDTKPNLIIVDSDGKQKIKKVKSYNGKLMAISDIPFNNGNNLLIRPYKTEWGILFSSGSTGISKAIIYEHQTMVSELLAWILEIGITRQSTFYIGRPISYTGGLVLALATLLVGGTVILNSDNIDNDFSEIWLHYQKCLNYWKVDFTFFVPDQIRHFTKIAKNTIGGPTILVMGAAISSNEKKVAKKVLKSPIIESWGNTEGLGTITDISDLEKRPDSIGRPFLTEEIFIVTEDLEHCPPSQRGRLAGTDETMFVEYANRPSVTERVKKKNIILSDDIGYMDSDGYFYIEGRSQESFIFNCETIFVSDIEHKIREIDGVKENCIILSEFNNIPRLYIAIIADASHYSSIKQLINNKLEFKYYQIHFIDKIPRLASGKMDKLTLKQIIEENNERI